MTCVKRLQKELKVLKDNKEIDQDIVLIPSNATIMHWKATITASNDSIYSGFKFDLDITIPSEYPLVPPTIKFLTKIFHPNVHFDTGEICLDILKKEWSPAWSLQSACRAIISLLSDPAADSPLNCDAGNMIRAGDMRAYKSMARMYCIDCAIPI